MHLVLLDRNSPYITKAIEYLQNECPETPYIFCIKNETNSVVSRLSKYAPANILYTPFSPEHLANIIEITLNQSVKKVEKNGNSFNDFKDIQDGHLMPELVPHKFAFFKSGIEIVKVFFDEIKYIYSDHVYVFIVTFNKKIPLRSKLEDIENFLPNNPFQRIHQRFIVNIDHIIKVNTDVVFMEEQELPLSKKYKKALLSNMNIFN